MAWLPHFLSPLSALIAAGITVPLLLLLYFLKLRRREVPVSSTFLWKKAVQDLQVNAPFQRLRKNLLLFLQLLLLFSLIAALARPVANYTPAAGKLSVILIDRSASMSAPDAPNGRTRLDEAKRQALDLVAGMERGGRATVIAFDDEPEIVQTFTSDTQALKTAIQNIVATDRRSKLSMALQLADAQTSFIPEGTKLGVKPEVYLYSDGRVLDSSELHLQGDLRYQKIGSDTAGNVAVVALDARRNYDQPVQVQVFARLGNFGTKPVNTEVRLYVDGVPTTSASVALAPARWSDPDWVKKNPNEKDDTFINKDSVQFTVEMPSAGVIKVEQMAKEGDMLATDDSAEVVVPPPKALSALLVTAAHDNPFLESAFACTGLKDSKVMLSDEYEDKPPFKQNPPKDYDVIIFDRCYPSAVPPGANLIYFGCAPTEGPLHFIKDGEVLQTVDDCSILDWQRDNPILRGLPLGKLYAGTMFRLAVPLNDQVLIDGLKGPMVVLDKQGRSTRIVCAFDVLQSNWPLSKSFPAFMQNAMQYLALGSDMSTRPSYEPGASIRIPRSQLERLGSDLKSIRLNGPMGSRDVTIPATGDFVLPALNKVGIYKTDPPVPQYEQIAVNLLDDNESNLLPANAPPGNIGTAVTVAGGKSRLELWWWLAACCALPLVMIEWWVYSRRVHL